MNNTSLALFEEGARQNGQTYWYAHDLMQWLGYSSWQSFRNVITKAIGLCSRIDLDPTESFIRDEIDIDGKPTRTYRLTRFACLLVAMAADTSKPEVVKMQITLAAVADHVVQQHIQSCDLARLDTREDLKAAEKAMSQAAFGKGLPSEKFGIFKDYGFRGMYNMPLKDLREFKQMTEGKTLYDFMGLEEMAGNLFRVTQTAARIRHQSNTGSIALSNTAYEVGNEVREMMVKNSGLAPEYLPLEENVKNVQRRLKKINNGMKKLDKPKRKIKLSSRNSKKKSLKPNLFADNADFSTIRLAVNR